MDGQPSRRQLLAAAAGTVAAAGTAGQVSGHDGDHGPAEAVLGPVRDAPYLVQSVDKFDWEPNHLVVPTGATVTFLGNQFSHTATSAATIVDAANCTWNGEGEPDTNGSGKTSVTVQSPQDAYNLTVQNSDSATITYQGAGSYPYWCVPHCGQRMIGKVVVVEP